MKKLLKVLGVIVLAFICVIGFGNTTAKADETVNDDVVIVYANVPADWQNPCVWAWGEDGTNAFEAWPGGTMSADENNPGWYYIYVPKFVSAVIINANEGSVQTSDLANGSADCWIVVTDAENAVASNEKQTEGELPQYVSTFKVNAYVPEEWLMPCLWAWSAPDGTNVFANWPGQELEQSADGWYSYSVPAWVNSVIINANAGGVQTSDISVEARDLWIVVSDADNYELFYEKPQVEEETIKVHAKTPEDWLMPCLWAWSAPDGTNVFANWPGQELEQEGEWYTYSIPAWVNSVIINGNLGGIQTSDISIDPEDVWIVVSGSEDAYTVFYEEPSAEELAALTQTDTEPEPTQEVSVPDASEPEKEADSTADEKNNTTLYIILGAAAAAVIAVAAVVIVKKKKK